MTLRAPFWPGVLGLTVGSGAVHAEMDRSHIDAQVTTEAAQRLSWSGDNRDCFLIKHETLIAPVAVVFGDGDNGAACEDLANILYQHKARAGTFKYLQRSADLLGGVINEK